MIEHMMTSSKFKYGEIIAFKGELYRIIDIEPLENTETFKYEYTLRHLIGEGDVCVSEKDLLTDLVA